VIDIDPLHSPYQKDGPPEGVHLSMDDVRELHPQDHVDYLETKAKANSSGMGVPNTCNTVNLHHCECVKVKEIEEYLSDEILGLEDRLKVVLVLVLEDLDNASASIGIN
jgi:hypothetical protein